MYAYSLCQRRLWHARPAPPKDQLFLYDVSSSYLEGDSNALAAWGYNRDHKEGKKQVVIGLLTDSQGEPVSIQVYRGNTNDPKTFGHQVHKIKSWFFRRRCPKPKSPQARARESTMCVNPLKNKAETTIPASDLYGTSDPIRGQTAGL